MKSIIICAFALLCLFQFASTQCTEGYYQIDDNYGDGAKICLHCGIACTACDANGACTAAIAADGLVTATSGGVTTFTSPCNGQSSSPQSQFSTLGFNMGDDRCDLCMTGCSNCYVDYDKCGACISGFEFHRDSLTCARAEIGLTATVLALSVLVLIVSIIGCIKAKQ